MIFVDASAIVAILTGEPERRSLVEQLERHTLRSTSAIAIFEAALAVARIDQVSLSVARRAVTDFLDTASITMQSVDGEVAGAAIAAHVRYGKGHHPAKLNMGDCFAYACARLSGAELLYKGDDFDATDLATL